MHSIVMPSPVSQLVAMGSFKAKNKVVLVMGATGTGKSRLAIDLAIYFGGEIVNSDKMQVYDALDVVTNKVTPEEAAGVPHHLLGCLAPDEDFTAAEFRRTATRAVASVARRGRLPIVAGGSNSYIEELVDGGGGVFRRRNACCLLWVDVQMPVLHRFVADRVDRMVERGMVEEVRRLWDPQIAAADYTRGVRRAIGVPELDRYLRAEASGADQVEKARLLEAAVDEIKANNCKLTCCQLEKIRRLASLSGWNLVRVDATEVFRKKGAEADSAWAAQVVSPSIQIVSKFLEAEADAAWSSQVVSPRIEIVSKFLEADAEAVQDESASDLAAPEEVAAYMGETAVAAMINGRVDLVKVPSSVVQVVGAI
ncbi:adenylate isopentenyltransferase 5, chloroplastic-like isoform X1 [Zingiber officinale]|uniref:adenylate isopentenyltransferase 5, chloroplastic-like isoform X1 n=2 Tax=Zingiber officinale TaxID=94328 RepID=UPI001C4B05F5|nr:adenylate isopentenyltransferase 5, chloroplastic-like isoform X1 [Zingiber officinale]